MGEGNTLTISQFLLIGMFIDKRSKINFMSTLLQSISILIDNITVTDRQEANIENSVANLDAHLKKEESGLSVLDTFTNGSWERDTIIRPLDDVDIFCVLKREDWEDEDGELPSPQSVLSKMRNYLNGLNDYKDKVSQNRPCVTITLSDKNFDVLPSFDVEGVGYYIPNYDLQSWTISDPKKLTTDLNSTHASYGYKLKQTIRAIKYWNRENGKLIPSYHIEETAIDLFIFSSFTNYEISIRTWFNSAVLIPARFKSHQQYEDAHNKMKAAKEDLNEAKSLFDNDKKDEAIKIWKSMFGKEFPSTDKAEARAYSQQLTEGTLKVSSAGTIGSSTGVYAKSVGGFYGEVSKD